MSERRKQPRLRCARPYLVHVLGHPTRPLDVAAAPGDAQVFNCHNFCKLLSRAGLNYVYYGLPGSKVFPGGRCVELAVPPGEWEHGNEFHRAYTEALDAAVHQEVRQQPDAPHLLTSLYGCAQADLTAVDDLNLPAIEVMVGYDHCWAPYRVFPSYAHQSVIYANTSAHVQDYIWFDTVIPHFLDPDDYWIRRDKGGYALFMGRDVPVKGRHIAEYVCHKAGIPLRSVHGGFHGREKTELIARAVAVFMPTIYLEPFGYVAVEAQMCGVPAITTDWGAFAETVEQSKTGFRCRTAAEFARALELAPRLDPESVRRRAVRRYGIDAVLAEYTAYFDFVWSVHHEGYTSRDALRAAFRRQPAAPR